MTETTADSPTANAFIVRWAHSGAAERANHQLFISELCDLIGVPHPDPSTPDNSKNAYVFERSITFQDGDGKTSPGFIDLYKRGCFVLEAKQGANAQTEEPMSLAAQELKQKLRKGHGQRGSGAWDDSMLRARGQADRYIRALPTEEGRPPFLIVLDVGHSIELFSEFSCTGGTYIPFPAAGSHRIFLSDLQRPEMQKFSNASLRSTRSERRRKHRARSAGCVLSINALLALHPNKANSRSQTIPSLMKPWSQPRKRNDRGRNPCPIKSAFYAKP